MFWDDGVEKILGNAKGTLRRFAEYGNDLCGCGGKLAFVPVWSEVIYYNKPISFPPHTSTIFKDHNDYIIGEAYCTLPRTRTMYIPQARDKYDNWLFEAECELCSKRKWQRRRNENGIYLKCSEFKSVLKCI